jgi:hypothetical protein
MAAVEARNAGPSTDHPSDEDLSLGTPTAPVVLGATGFAQDDNFILRL